MESNKAQIARELWKRVNKRVEEILDYKTNPSEDKLKKVSKNLAHTKNYFNENSIEFSEEFREKFRKLYYRGFQAGLSSNITLTEMYLLKDQLENDVEKVIKERNSIAGHTALKITETAQNNTFINSVINGGVQVDGSGNRFINTFVNNIKKGYREHILVSWIIILSAIFTIVWPIFIYIFPKHDLSADLRIIQNRSSVDLREALIEPIFDVASKIYQFKSDYDRNEYINERKERHFSGAGEISNFGKLPNGEIWATLRGDATDNSPSSFECHFDSSWENTIKNLVDTGKVKVIFEGQIGYYIQGILVATNCKIDNVE